MLHPELKAIAFKSRYITDDLDFSDNYYAPALSASTQLRLVISDWKHLRDMFSPSSLAEFINRDGKISIIFLIQVSEQERETLKITSDERIIIESFTYKWNSFFTPENQDETVTILFNLIAEGKIEIQIVNGSNIYDSNLLSFLKSGVRLFTDDHGNALCFQNHVSDFNFDSITNEEMQSCIVHRSWGDLEESNVTQSVSEQFERVMNRSFKDIITYDIPEDILYSLKWRPDKKHITKLPMQHQTTALENWVANGRRGIFKHATGTGKTFTAICAIRDALDRGQSVLILVPSRELLKQWKRELDSSIKDIDIKYLICGDNNNSWKKNNLLHLYTQHSSTMKMITISTMDTACKNDFIKKVASGKHLFLLVDEVHRIGSPVRQNTMKIDATERLGLSATPERHSDSDGTKAILN